MNARDICREDHQDAGSAHRLGVFLVLGSHCSVHSGGRHNSHGADGMLFRFPAIITARDSRDDAGKTKAE